MQTGPGAHVPSLERHSNVTFSPILYPLISKCECCCCVLCCCCLMKCWATFIGGCLIAASWFRLSWGGFCSSWEAQVQEAAKRTILIIHNKAKNAARFICVAKMDAELCSNQEISWFGILYRSGEIPNDQERSVCLSALFFCSFILYFVSKNFFLKLYYWLSYCSSTDREASNRVALLLWRK